MDAVLGERLVAPIGEPWAMRPLSFQQPSDGGRQRGGGPLLIRPSACGAAHIGYRGMGRWVHAPYLVVERR